MFGSVMRGQVKAGRREEFEREFASIPAHHFDHGLVSAELAWEANDSNRVLVIIHFRDRQSYEVNASRPETNADFERQRALLEGDPEWIDVEYGPVTTAAPVPA